MAKPVQSAEPWLVFLVSFRMQKASNAAGQPMTYSPPVEVIGHFAKIDAQGNLEIHAKAPQDRVVAAFASGSWLSCYPVVPSPDCVLAGIGDLFSKTRETREQET